MALGLQALPGAETTTLAIGIDRCTLLAHYGEDKLRAIYKHASGAAPDPGIPNHQSGGSK